MGRGQMRNPETLGVGTGTINEFEYQKNQGELTEQLEHHGNQEDATSEAATTADRVKQIMADAHQKVEERKRKGISRAARKKAEAKKSTAKKPAARNLASKRSTARRAIKKSSKKSAAKKSATKSTKKAAARKSTAKKAAPGTSKSRKR